MMKLIFRLFITLALFTACDKESNNQDKYDKVAVSFSHDSDTMILTVTNNNEEKVTVTVYITCKTALNTSETKTRSIRFNLEPKASEIKMIPLGGFMTYYPNLNYTVN